MDWTSILQNVPAARPVVTEDSRTSEQLQREYIAATIVPNTYYSIEKTVQHQNEEGNVEESQEHVFSM